MPVLPDRDAEFIDFCETHLPIFTEEGSSLGLSPSMLSSFTTATNTIRSSFTAAQAARTASKAATTTLSNDLRSARAVAADLIRTIKAFAENQSNPAAVYALAQIPQPAAPTPAPLPTKPTDINVQLNPDGSVTLSWASQNAAASSGAFFNVSRKLPGGTFLPLGGAPGGTPESGRRMFFTDATLPTSAAAEGAQYIIQGYRGTRSGEPSDAITVQFGVEGQGATVTGATLKMAA